MSVKVLVRYAIFLALAYVFPFLTGEIPQIGSMLCPMHIPVILCGFICGWKYGLIIGLISPLLRSFTISMPPFFPTATAMSFELAAYGVFSGLLYNGLPKKKISIYISLICSMVIGRIIWGTVMFALMGFNPNNFGLTTFWFGAFANAIPGIILQIVFIPSVIIIYERFSKHDNI